MKDIYTKVKQIFKQNWIWIVCLIALICFVGIAEDVYEQELMKSDTLAYSIIVENLRNDTLTNIMKFITNLGGTYILIGITIILLIVVKKKKIGIAVLSNLVFISGFNLVIKNIVQRPRPEGYRLISESGYSFPSGHSMISTAFYGFLIYLIYKNVENKYIKYTLCIVLTILIPLIAVSRVYLGVHYASDVIAGFLLSISYLICFAKIYNSIKIKNENQKQTEKEV